MECREEPDGTLVLTYDSKAWARFFFILALFMPATAAYDYFIGTRGDDRLIGLVGGFVTLALAGLVFYEQAQVVIDPATRTIVWKRRWGFSRRSGSLAFDQVESVLPERPIGDHGVPSRRIVLRTKSGEMVPLTVGYKPDGGDEILRASERIVALLGRTTGTPLPDAVQALVDAGRTMDAIALLRETRGLSLTDAKREVDALRKSR